jgi:hypothetical protein
MFEGFAGLFARLLARANLVFVGILLCDIWGSFSVTTAPGAVTTEAPQWHHRQQGRIPDGPTGPDLGMATVTLQSPQKSTPFCGEN